MGEPFDVDLNNPQGVSLTPQPTIATTPTAPAAIPPAPPTPAELNALPSVQDVLGPRPVVPVPAPPPPPPSPTQDPRQQLLALIALGMAAGQGVRGGGAGALQGFAETQQHLRADQLAEYQRAVNDYEKQRQQAAVDQRKLDTETDTREQNLKTALLNFSRAVQAKPDDEDNYRQQVAIYSTALRNAGYRTMTPQFFFQNLPFTPPDELTSIKGALDAYFKSPMVAEVAKSNPQAVFQGKVSYRVPGQRTPAQISVVDAMKRTGIEPGGLNPDGSFALSPAGTGSEYADSIARATAEYGSRFGHPPARGDASANDWIAKRADQLRAKPTTPVADELARLRLEDERRKNDPTGGLTPEGLDYAATQYRITRSIPSVGRDNPLARTPIVNRAAQQATTLGQTPAQAIQQQASFRADTDALTQMRKMSSSANAFENKALAQTQIIADLSRQVPRTDLPILNDVLLRGRRAVFGDPKTTQLYNAIQTFSAEYAKIIEGATGSSAGSSDAARKASGELINAAMNPAQLQGTLDLMAREMRLTVQGYDATIEDISSRMGGASAPRVAPAPAPADDLSSALDKLQRRRSGRGQ